MSEKFEASGYRSYRGTYHIRVSIPHRACAFTLSLDEAAELIDIVRAEIRRVEEESDPDGLGFDPGDVLEAPRDGSE